MASSRSVRKEAAALESLIDELERDRSLEKPDRLRERIDALDCLDAYFSWGLPSSDASGLTAKKLLHRAERISSKLESLNQELYRSIRREIQQGVGKSALLRWNSEWNGALNDAPFNPATGQNYDYLDELISGVLKFQEPPEGVCQLAEDMVFYQPTPARHIFELIRRSALIESDVFVDLGSGLGHVPLIVSICTEARCIGVEIEPAYVRCSLKCTQALSLNNVTFVQGDARATDLSGGTVFYLYTPFVGSMLRTMLDLLRQEGCKREIRVCTFGPCTSVVSEEPWLGVAGPLALDGVTIFCSRHST